MLITRLPFERAMGMWLLVLTVILSLLLINSPGTGDVWRVLKWTDVLSQDGLISGYSKVINDFHTDYPPISHAILYTARAFGDTVGLSPLMSFKVTILTFQLVSTALILLSSRSYWLAAAFNGSLILSSVGLGYQDVWFAPSLIAAFLAFRKGRNILGTALFLTASLTKWQPLIVAPFIAVYILEISSLQSCRDAIGKRLLWQLVVLIGATIALLSLIFGLAPERSLWHGMHHPFWSAYALNLPWAMEFLYKLLFSSSFSRFSSSFLAKKDEYELLFSPSLRQDELPVLAPPSIYLLSLKVFFWSIFGTIIICAIRSEKTLTNCLLFSIVGLFTYAIWSPGVHENHLFVAVILAYILMLHDRAREHLAIVVVLTVMFNVNMFVFYGVTGTKLQSSVVGVDLTGVLAMLYVIAWLLLALYAWGAATRREEGKNAEGFFRDKPIRPNRAPGLAATREAGE